MQSLRLLSRIAMLTFCLAIPTWAADDDASQELQTGVALFEDGKYLAAQEVLLSVDRDALTEDERALRDDYVDRISKAINMVEKAGQEIEEAQAALETKEWDKAGALFESVLGNEYAPAIIREAAEEGLRDIAAGKDRERNALQDGPVTAQEMAGSVPAPPVSDPEPAAVTSDVADSTPEPVHAPPAAATVRPATDATAEAGILTQRGHDAMDQGRLDDALGLFNRALAIVPGYPEAVAGIQQALAHEKVESGSLTLIEQIRRRNRVRWQRVVASYSGTETETRDHVVNDRFDLAQQALLRARQIVESGKEFAEPLSRYESLRAEVDALGKWVDDAERHYNEMQVRTNREEVAKQDRARLDEIRQTKQRRIDALMNQAYELRKDRDWKRALGVLEQVVAIDPLNDQARWMLDDLEEMYQFLRQREAYDTKRKETQDVLAEVEETKIPWHEFIRYPKNWLEIVSRPERVVTGKEYLTPEDHAIRTKLETKIPFSFDDTPFVEVIETLQETQQLNFNVIWSDLDLQDIGEDSPISLEMQTDISLNKALEEMLAQLGGGTVELGYLISEGVISIATRDYLDRRVFVEVYDIMDLLMRVPDFTDAPTVSLEQGGGGGGAGGGSSSQNPFQGGGGDVGGEDDRRSRRERAEEIVELIRITIEPESWREAGGTDASIRALEGNLVVTQTASAHEQVADLLAQLRQERAIQVAVEARFLTVTANFLEEMGIDLDIILNQGNAGYDRVNNLDAGTALLMPRSFSRMGFTPAVPGVGVALDPRAMPSTSVTNIRQPYANVALVPEAGGNPHSGSRMTPIPLLNNVLDLTATQSTSIPGSLGGLETAAMQVFGSFLDNIQVDFMLRATQADRRASSMSAPRLVLTNGQWAWIGILREQAYVATVQPVVDETAVAQQPQTNMIYTGTTLLVQATVGPERHYVTMTLIPGVATLDGIQLFPYSGGAAGTAAGGGFIQLPTRHVQQIKTTVTVPDQGTLLIGGMKTTEEVEIEAGVPVLSKIPVLKRLYSNRSLVKDETVLLILVKPTVIISTEAEEDAFPTFGARG